MHTDVRCKRLNKVILTSFQYGNTSLKLAAEKGHCKTVELLMSKGADVNKADKVVLSLM